MCLTIKTTFHKKGKPIVAERSILVYKMLERYMGKKYNNQYHTPYMGTPINFCDEGDNMYFYKTTRLQKDLSLSPCSSDKYISKGIHSFSDKKTAIDEVNMYNEGSLYRMSMHYAVIPKGSKFFIGSDGDIVSTNLVVFKRKKDYDKNKKLFGRTYELGRYLTEFWHEDCKSK